MKADNDRNCLTYWFPKLVAAGVPVPMTRIVTTQPDLAGGDLVLLMDGAEARGFDAFLKRLLEAADAVALATSWPVFLRTGHTSGKHNWRETCHWRNREHAARHVGALVGFSHEVDFLGLPHDVFVVREMLKTEPILPLPRYGGMPLTGEIRAFVGGGEVLCLHAYWPAESIRQGLGINLPEGVRVAGVVQSPGLVGERLAALDGSRRYDKKPGGGIPSVLVPHAGKFSWDTFRNPLLFAEFYQNLGLSPLDAEEREKPPRCIGGYVVGDAPVEQWLSADAVGGNDLHRWTAKQFTKNVDTRPRGLLNLDHLNERGVLGEGGLPWLSDVDTERPVGVEQPRTVGEQRNLVLFFSHGYTPGSGYTRTSLIVLPLEYSVKNGRWWPSKAIRDGMDPADVLQKLEVASVAAATMYIEDVMPVAAILSQVAEAFKGDGEWSVDLLPTADGKWFVTDMAAAERSYHDPACSRVLKKKAATDGEGEGKSEGGRLLIELGVPVAPVRAGGGSPDAGG